MLETFLLLTIAVSITVPSKCLPGIHPRKVCARAHWPRGTVYYDNVLLSQMPALQECIWRLEAFPMVGFT